MNALPQPKAQLDADAVTLPLQDLNGSLRLLTCGSVDDGKSSLIGRLLWDADDLYDDQRETLARSSGAGVSGNQPDFSQLVDGLAAEREQGITIDIAWRYFDTDNRRFIIIDSPGHEQYTRNMASGASHADVAIMLVDARHGVKTQTRRHAAILDLMGVKRVILAVNKMDLVEYSQDTFLQIEKDFGELTKRFGFVEALAMPVSAVMGDNVASRSKNMSWYSGPVLLEFLEGLPSRAEQVDGPFRMPVQMVLRDGLDFRGLAGTVSAGRVAVGDHVADSLSGKHARVARIATMDGDLEVAAQGQAVVLELDTDIDVARGDLLSHPQRLPVAARKASAQIVWLSETAFDAGASYLLRTATDLVSIERLKIAELLDLETLATTATDKCEMNDIAIAQIDVGRPVALDTFGAAPETGSFMIVDAVSGASVAAGVVVEAQAGGAAASDDEGVYVLDRATLARGICQDLGEGAAAEAEFRRRADEVAALLRGAGVRVRLAL